MTKRKEFESIIWKLPLSPIGKFRLIRDANLLYNSISGKRMLNDNVALLNSNSYYGHEYWMKRYSGWKKPILGLIEHGVYFGNNMNKVGDEREYLLGNIITYGDYREEIIRIAFPDYRVIKVGPRIAYAETDRELLKEFTLESKGRKVLTLFPAHSLADCKFVYDVDYLISRAREVMAEHQLGYLRVCMKEQDLINGNADLFSERGCAVVTAGASSITFLPRLRAIIESSEMTMSNSLGTHLGYCIYLKKPHVLIQQDKSVTGAGDEYKRASDLNSAVNIAYQKEEALFIRAFGDSEKCITDAQHQLCDYYWGFSHVKRPGDLYRTLECISEKH